MYRVVRSGSSGTDLSSLQILTQGSIRRAIGSSSELPPWPRGFLVCFGVARKCLSPLLSFRVQQLTDGRTFAGLLFLRRNFTLVIKSFTGGPSGIQMEDANTKAPVTVSFLSPCAVQPNRRRVRRSPSLIRPVSDTIPAFLLPWPGSFQQACHGDSPQASSRRRRGGRASGGHRCNDARSGLSVHLVV